MKNRKSKIENHKSLKLPFLDIQIVKGKQIRGLRKKISMLEFMLDHQADRIRLEAKMSARQLHQLAVLQGKIKAPLCPKCNKPKIAGGIQWLDHPIGCGKKNHEVTKTQRKT